MKKNANSLKLGVRALLGIGCLFAARAHADGTETLGIPSLNIAPGKGIVAAGTGLVSQPGLIEFDVPAGEEIQQVLLYWSGEFRTLDDDTIEVDGVEVPGTLIGGPTFFFSFQGSVYSSSYRADITDLGLVVPGANALTITGLDYDHESAGAGILVIYGDCSKNGGSQGGNNCRNRGKRGHRCSWRCRPHTNRSQRSDDCADIEVLDGLDIAFFNFSEPRRTTIPQTFTFEAARVDRVADLVIFTGSVAEDRPNEIHITVDGNTTEIINLLGDLEGPSWDAPTIPVEIPKGATSVTVEIVSTQSTDPLGASVVWVTAALAVPDAPRDSKPNNYCKRTRYQKPNWGRQTKSGQGWCRRN